MISSYGGNEIYLWLKNIAALYGGENAVLALGYKFEKKASKSHHNLMIKK